MSTPTTREELNYIEEYLMKSINTELTYEYPLLCVEDLPMDFQKVLMSYVVDKLHELDAQGG